VRGVLAHPTERRREDVSLDDDRCDKVESAIRGIHAIVTADSPPEATEKPYCESLLPTTTSVGSNHGQELPHLFGRPHRTERDTVRLETDDGEKHIPVEHAGAIYLHGQIDYNTRLMSFLNDHGVAVHVFGWNDRYAGSLMPERGQTSGRTVVEQVRAYDDPEQRQSLAASFVRGSIHNMRTNVTYYDSQEYELGGVIEELDNATARIDDAGDISGAHGCGSDGPEARTTRRSRRFFPTRSRSTAESTIHHRIR